MPGMDKTGPRGTGPIGRGEGPCQQNVASHSQRCTGGNGRGQGGGNGRANGGGNRSGQGSQGRGQVASKGKNAK